MVHELEYGWGFVLMRGFPVELYEYADLRRIYWGIGTQIGLAESQNIKGELIQEITDLGFDYTKSEHRGSMSSAELRPHCDPTDIVSLPTLSADSENGRRKQDPQRHDDLQRNPRSASGIPADPASRVPL